MYDKRGRIIYYYTFGGKDNRRVEGAIEGRRLLLRHINRSVSAYQDACALHDSFPCRLDPGMRYPCTLELIYLNYGVGLGI